MRGLGLMNTPSPSSLLGWRVAPAPRHSRRAYVAETRASTSTAQQVPKQAVECSRARVYPRVGTPPHARSPQISLTPPPSWTARGCVSRIWGRSGGDLGEIWGDLGQIWGRSGEIWGRSRGIWGDLGRSGGDLGRSGGDLPHLDDGPLLADHSLRRHSRRARDGVARVGPAHAAGRLRVGERAAGGEGREREAGGEACGHSLRAVKRRRPQAREAPVGEACSQGAEP